MRGSVQEPHHVLADGAKVEANGEGAEVDYDGEQGADGKHAVGEVVEVEEGALGDEEDDGERAQEGEEVAIVDEARENEKRVVEDEEHHRQCQKGALASSFLIARRREVGTEPCRQPFKEEHPQRAVVTLRFCHLLLRCGPPKAVVAVCSAL